jgi:hypothetical protein
MAFIGSSLKNITKGHKIQSELLQRAICDVRKISTDGGLREGIKMFTPGYACV